MTETVQYQLIEETIALITLDRPEAANAFSLQLLDDLTNVVEHVNKQKDIRATIITASGEKAFCAGADLKERAGMTDDEVVQTVHKIGQTVHAVENIKSPVICAINGVAFGGGLELALACDLRVAADHAKFGLTETSLGIIPGAGGTQRLPRLIGLGKAKEMIYAAKRVNAEEAFTIGLVERVSSSQSLLDEALKLARSIASNAPVALRQAKQAINKGFHVDLETGLQIESMSYAVTIPTEDRLEGLKAFKEKRKPKYKGQ
ncbi:enoyl-CoA hydratase [Pontibacillus sp. HMF3514]|uniref:enoyl-CoA hydratase n=1 Tax=Pontibacillus sp. HMF3514 TaxID=2692425 RepID=UPI00131F50F9|nr:enoyl-CoA hydratase [Pontibacillus sp. HMF3514]QHE52336.1 enoyl-CoA hydratase [Pontibacillus sp. HMF3514]